MTEDRLKDKIDNAQEAEADPDRHAMEEAVLATLAKGGPDDPFALTFNKAYGEEMLAFSRGDLEAVARALWSLVLGACASCGGGERAPASVADCV